MISFVKIFSLICATIILSACQTGGANLKYKTIESVKFNPQETNYEKLVQGLFFKPEGEGPFPAVVLLHSCGGIRSHISEHWPKLFVNRGYVVLTMDTFGSRGMGNCKYSIPAGYSHYKMARDAYSGLEYLRKLSFVDSDNVAVMGFSLGAYVILEQIALFEFGATGDRKFKAGIALYSECKSFGRSVGYKVPNILVIMPDKDKFFGTCDVEPGGVSYARHVIKNAHHSFDEPEWMARGHDIRGNVMEYSANATREAQKVVADYLANIFGK